MAGDEQTSLTAFAKCCRRQSRAGPQHGVDAGVASNENSARDRFLPQIGGGELGWREQQHRAGIDCRAIFLFGPRQRRIVAAQTGFDMCDRESGPEARERATKSARRVALDDKQVRTFAEASEQGFGDMLDMAVRIGGARAMKMRCLAIAETMFGGIEVRMLPGDDQRRLKVERGEGSGNWSELDRFGPSADDQPDIRATQISP